MNPKLLIPTLLVAAIALSGSFAQAQADESAPTAPVSQSSAKAHKAKKSKAKKSTKAAPKSVKATHKKKSYLERVVTTQGADSGTGRATPSVKPEGTDHGARLSRDIVFDGSTVNGQYHSAGEAVAKVEQEKKLNELAGVRKDFRDRLLAEKERLQRGEPVSPN